MGEKRKRDHRIMRRDAAQIVLNVRRFFELEAAAKKRIGLHQITRRVMEAKNLGRCIVVQIQSQEDVDLLPKNDYVENRKKLSQIPAVLFTHVRQAIRFNITEKKQLPTLDMIYEYLKQPGIHPECTFSRSSMYRFMLQNGLEFTSPDNY